MKSCDFDNEEFPKEILKLAKEQLTLMKLKISNFLYTLLQVVVFFQSFFQFYKFRFCLKIPTKKFNSVFGKIPTF